MRTGRWILLGAFAGVGLCGGCESALGLHDIDDRVSVDGGAGRAGLGGEAGSDPGAGGTRPDNVGGHLQTGGKGGDNTGGQPETGGTGGDNTGGQPETGGTGGDNTGGQPETGGTGGDNTGGQPETGGTGGDNTGGQPQTGGAGGTGGGATGGTGGEPDVDPGLDEPCDLGFCPEGLVCVGDVCKLDLGEECAKDEDCEIESCAFSICREPVGETGTCDTTADCQAAFACGSGTCKRLINAACTADSQCASGSCYNTKCRAPATLLGACDGHPDCAANLQCISSQCKFVNGQACGTTDTDCYSGSCAPNNTCQDKAGLNSACNSAADCHTGLACTNNICKIVNSSVCNYDTECASGICAPTAVGASTKACRATPAAALASCDSEADCVAALICQASACRIPFGSSCASAASACEVGTICDGTNYCLGDSNWPCTDSNECAWGNDCYSYCD